jgi:transcriptional regulator with PAS, ATPase and Fis domain
MDKPRALLIQSLGSSLASVRKLLEERNLVIHLSRTWEEAERAYNAFPSGQIKFIFADVTLCQGNGWEKFIQRARTAPSDIVIVCFHSQFPNSLYDLVERSYPVPDSQLPAGETADPAVVGDTRQFREVLDLACRYASHDITILITGETGTGKEVVARYIHNQSSRNGKPFIPCNMTAIPETLVESELFGYLKGAFTGADKNKRGLIEAAEGGTLFLDEIGDLPPAIQLKLLRFLESREFYKVGDSSPKFADVRIIAATNKDLDKAILENGFRKDLYYRLNSARIILPPLRDRREDIILLVANSVYQTCRQTQKPIKKISSSVKVLLLDYPWPGNIRELKNVVESAVMVSDDEYLTLSDLPMHLQQYATNHREEIGAKAIRNISEAEREIIEQALKEANGNKAKAAELLGISTRTLYRKIVKFSGPVIPDISP